MKAVKWLFYGFMAILPLLLVISPIWAYYSFDNIYLATGQGLIVLFIVLPIIDELTKGLKINNEYLSKHPLLLLLPALVLPLLVILIGWGLIQVYALYQQQLYMPALLLTISIGVVNGSFGINAAHELLHRRQSWCQTTAGVMLSLCGYGGFKIEHVFGHHKDLATDNDPSSAAKGDMLLPFFIKAMVLNQLKAFKLQAKFKNKLQFGGQEYYLWQGLFGLCLLLSFVYAGWLGLAYFIVQSVFAIFMLEVVNYIEHYGLRRNKRNQKSYEAVQYHHCWNCSNWLTNYVLFQLPRHSDHHVHANKPFYELKDHPQAPQLPFGYATLVVFALIPPLWFYVMNPRLERYVNNA
ncbi:alkane 1-monooxygenase [Paraferrimonas sp. SM1919]|uniref:alkane 1-monooxygenase n=1 Tax=Paraferrimonas sp. SM1919 TaxID=2662263 RepID=UPI0013D50016|nr:alkane 1-monooxygenase [Paraferrimonas sp. SM1919]